MINSKRQLIVLVPAEDSQDVQILKNFSQATLFLFGAIGHMILYIGNYAMYLLLLKLFVANYVTTIML